MQGKRPGDVEMNRLSSYYCRKLRLLVTVQSIADKEMMQFAKLYYLKKYSNHAVYWLDQKEKAGI